MWNHHVFIWIPHHSTASWWINPCLEVLRGNVHAGYTSQHHTGSFQECYGMGFHWELSNLHLIFINGVFSSQHYITEVVLYPQRFPSAICQQNNEWPHGRMFSTSWLAIMCHFVTCMFAGSATHQAHHIHDNWHGRHHQLLLHVNFWYILKLCGMVFSKYTSSVSSSQCQTV